jgi:hypothetical protein
MLGITPRVVHVEFVVGKVALGRIFSKHFGFPLPTIILPIFHTHLEQQFEAAIQRDPHFYN